MTGSVAPLRSVESTKLAPSGAESDNQKSAKRPKEADWPKDVWDAVHADYRTGTRYGKLSEIYGIPVELIVRRKQRDNWRTDLRHDVAAETFAALAVGTSGDGASRHLSDEDVVQAAAQRGAEVVTQHRRVLSDAIAAVGTLASDLRRAVEAHSKGDLVGLNMAFLGTKETLSEAALKLGNALARIVPLERKAFGLDEGGDGRPYEDTLAQWYGQKAAERAKAGG